MIPCERCEELINARLDGYLTQEDARLLEEHLAQCPDCQKLDRDLTTLHTRLGQLASDPPEELAAAILTQLEVPTMSSESKKKKTPWAAIACAAAAVVLMVVVLTPQMSPFGGSDAESAGAAEAPTASDIAADAAPAEGEEAAPEESRAESETQELKVEPLTEKEAYDLLVDYLIDLGVSLDLSAGSISEDGSFWTFTGRDMDSGDRFLFNVYSVDGFVEEILLP